MGMEFLCEGYIFGMNGRKKNFFKDEKMFGLEKKILKDRGFRKI